MKKGVNPDLKLIEARCSCGNSMFIYSTLCKDINIDICNICHPFYTGQQKIIEKKGRIEKFNTRYSLYKE